MYVEFKLPANSLIQSISRDVLKYELSRWAEEQHIRATHFIIDFLVTSARVQLTSQRDYVTFALTWKTNQKYFEEYVIREGDFKPNKPFIKTSDNWP
jgi:hypothetical protein